MGDSRITKNMDSTEVLSKLMQVIKAISSVATEATVNARNCIKLAASVQSLEPVMLEIQQQSRLPIIGGAITSFEGLEHALYKCKAFIQKCGGDTSRIYALLRREKFAKTFQLLALEVASHLNSLPLGALELTESVQDQMRECVFALKEAIYDIEGDNELHIQTRAALKQLTADMKLSRETLESLALKYGLASNQDILREAALLEKDKEQLKIEDEHEEDMINQLIILVTRMGDDLAEKIQTQEEHGRIPIPADFRCPLSLELMADPVIVASGQTYEREYIQQWLDQGNTTCPKTQQILTHRNLIPNYTVKALIANWCEGNNIPIPVPNKVNSKSPPNEKVRHNRNLPSVSHIGSNVEDSKSSFPSSRDGRLFNTETDECSTSNAMPNFGSSSHGPSTISQDRKTLSSSRNRRVYGQAIAKISIPSYSTASDDCAEGDENANILNLVEELQSSSVDTQRNAATSLRLLAKNGGVESRIVIANCGAIKPLVTLLNSPDSQTQENAVTALLNLSMNDNNKNEIAASGAIEPLIEVLRVGTPEAKENAAATLYSLSVMNENKIAIGKSGAILPLIELLKSGSPRGKKDAAIALFNLSIYHDNKTRIVAAGAVKPLLELISDPASGLVDKAVSVLSNLSNTQEGKAAIGEQGGIPALVEVVELGSERGRENAAAALLNLCTDNHRFRTMVFREGVIPHLVGLSRSGTPRAKEKALSLLRLFQEQQQGRATRERQRGTPYVY